MTARLRRDTLLDPIVDNNPVTLQVLGICSAVAITRSLWPALVMALAVTAVLVFTSVVVSALRGALPRSVRLLLEVTVIASAVTVADEFLKAFAPETARVLSVFVGLIITNCIVLGRLEGFALRNPVGLSALDALGNSVGYALILIAVAFVRELLGAGTLFDWPVLAGGGAVLPFRPNDFMANPASAFFIIGLLIWGLRGARGRAERDEFDIGGGA